ncbi:MAG TPA: potassium channel family protein [Marmoricola sp.]|nr:potassium channel family protein [Marmoricola sp.]
MGPAAIVVGALLVLLVFTDAFMTTLTVSWGRGPLSSRLLALLWRVLLGLHRRRGSALLGVAGPLLLVTTVLIWVLLLWVGWSLVFAGSGAVVEVRSGRSAGVLDSAYYAGYTVFTLGTGDVVVTSTTDRLVSVLASFTGLFLVTLAITYLVAVVSAVVRRRSLAIRIHGLGQDAGAIVVRGWRDGAFSAFFQQQLLGLTDDVVNGAEQHLAYPVLHYFHARDRALAASQAIVDLDEALLLLTTMVQPAARPDSNVTRPLRHGIGRYLTTVHGVGWAPPAGPPPPPDLEPLREHGIPLVPDAEVDRVLEREEPRRTELNRLVLSDGWTWTDR